MTEFVALSKAGHSGFGYAPDKPFSFAGNWSFIALSQAELGSVLPLYPICFQKNENGIQIGMPTGLGGVNCLVHPQNGRFLLPYAPAILRKYPYDLIKPADGEPVLCAFAAEKGFAKGRGEAIIDDENELTEKGKALLRFLQNLNASFEQTTKACSQLAAFGLLVPLLFQYKDPQNGELKTAREDLFRVDEHKLNRLDAEQLQTLMSVGAMSLIYAHLFSLQHLRRVSEATQNFAKLKQQRATRIENLDAFFGEEASDVLKFE
ncbi:SapC family protein [Thiomicrorhabdus cannonii]|uniref:SapC family protein n=1 Tax=Thiomicrorhabdus cannonii TaxID=2748011 RepID=UPI0015BE1A58|nr:SapC family protein [Thiomicrorhabdus cannonii]